MALYVNALIVGSIWLLLGGVTYYVYRRQKGLSLTETTQVALQPAVGVEPVEYAGVLLAFEENTYSESALLTALKLASHRKGAIRVVVTLTVPQHLDIAAPLPQVEDTARAIIEEARQWARRGQRIKGRIAKVRAGETGHRIVQEAIDAHAKAIVMPMPHHRPAGKLLNKTLEVVLAKRPCRVIIDSAPALPYERIPRAA
jgi:APA family basic amino acid/polyamine antiporter